MNFKFIVDKNYLLLKMISNRNNLEELKQWKDSLLLDILGTTIVKDIVTKKKLLKNVL